MPDQTPRFVVQTYDGERCVVVDTRWNTPIRMGKIFERDLASVIADTLNRRPYAQATNPKNTADVLHRQNDTQRSGIAPSRQPQDSVSARTRLRSASRRDNGAVSGRQRLVSRELSRCHGCGQDEGSPHLHYCDVDR